MENLRLEKLQEFKDTLDKDNKVSKSMVLSLEEFIGDNVVTRQVNPNKLTNLPSSTQLETVKTIVENEIKSEQDKVSIDEVFTAEDVVLLLNGKGTYALEKLLRIMVMLGKDCDTPGCIAPGIKVAAMKDEKIRYRYASDGEPTAELIDILDLPLDVVYGNYKAYFTDVKTILFDKTVGHIPEAGIDDINAVSLKYNVLLNIIDASDLLEATNRQLKPITLKDIITIISNSSVIIDKLEEWVELAGKYWDNFKDNLDLDPEIIKLYRGLIKLTKDTSFSTGNDFITNTLVYMFVNKEIEE